MRYGSPYLTALMVLATPAAAQLSGRADLSFSGRYVWHGISRGSGFLLQPSLAMGLRVRSLSLEGGAVLHYELDNVSPGELSEIGVGRGGLGEADYWGRASLGLGP